MKTSRCNKENKCKIEYPSLPSALRPAFHSAEIPIPDFVQRLSLESLGQDEELSDWHDTNFETENHSVLNGFD